MSEQPEQPQPEAVVKVEADLVQAAVAPPILSEEEVNELVVSGDYSACDNKQRAYILLVLCKKMGLDPMRRPFEFISDGKSVRLYANRSAAAQLRDTQKITQTPVYMGALRSVSFKPDGTLELGDVLSNAVVITIFKAESKHPETGEPRISYDVSALALDRQLEYMENGIKKMWTQAGRRTTIGHAGLGFLDESEAQDVGRPSSVSAAPAPMRVVPQVQQKAQVAPAPVPLRVPAPQMKPPAGIVPPPEATAPIAVEAQVVEAEPGPQRVAQKPQPAPPAATPAVAKPAQTGPQAAPRPASAPQGPRAVAQPGPMPQGIPAGPRPLARPLPPKPGPVKVMPGVTVGPGKPK